MATIIAIWVLQRMQPSLTWNYDGDELLEAPSAPCRIDLRAADLTGRPALVKRWKRLIKNLFYMQECSPKPTIAIIQITIAHFSSKTLLTFSETSGSRAPRKLPIAAPFKLSLK
jgi:hypothetical protein